MSRTSQFRLELIRCIEGYMIQEENTWYHKIWTEELRYWESRCEPTDHIEEKEWTELYNSVCYKESDLDHLDRLPAGEKLSGEQLDDLNEDLEALPDFWEPEHIDNREAWEDKLGPPTYSGRGWFSTHCSSMREHFGLEPWIAHTQELRPGSRSYASTDTTVAYLTLPRSGKPERIRRRPTDDNVFYEDGEPLYLPTESALGFSLKPPGKLSEKTVARFRWAMKIMHLEVADKQKHHDMLSIDEGDDKGINDAEELTGAGQGPAASDCLPELMFLIKTNDTPDEL